MTSTTKAMKNEFNGSEFLKVTREIFAYEAEHAGVPEDSLPPRTENLVAPGYPPMVQVGISQKCNLRCPECFYPIWSQQPGFSPKFMDVNLFHGIVDEVAEFPCVRGVFGSECFH